MPLTNRQVVDRVSVLIAEREEELGHAVVSALQAGIAVMFATTSDRGALSVTTFEGDQRRRSYCANADELVDALLAVRAQAER